MLDTFVSVFSLFWLKIRKKISFRQNKYSYQAFVSLFLFGVFITAVLSHVIFSVGLHHDGVHSLTRMIFDNSFNFFEKSRLFFHFLYQIPAWLFIKLAPSDSISLLTQVFSFGLVWIHILSIGGCWLILPKEKKNYIFFPLFAFLVGPLTALDHSISVSLSVFSYVWFMTFVVYYSDLSLNRHKILFLLTPLPLLLSHELMSYASLFLIFICLLKRKHESVKINKILITSLILFFTVTFFTASYFIVFPFSSGNRDRFLLRILNLGFLYNRDGVVYPYIASALILIVIPFLRFCRSFPLRILLLFITVFMSLILNTILLVPSPNDFLYQILPHHLYPVTFNRMWVFSVLPLTLLLWLLFEKKKLHFSSQKVFLTLCLISSVSLLKWRVQMDYNFYKFQKQFSENLESHKGILESKIVEGFSFVPEYLSHFYMPYLPLQSSLIFPRFKKVKVVILNSVNPNCLIACERGKNWDHILHI